MIVDPKTLVQRIDESLDVAASVFARFDPGRVQATFKRGDDPVTMADMELDRALRASLQRVDEGWLSEETADDLKRLDNDLVWIVDPLDGTREFVEGLPEFCASVAAVADGTPVAGGILNPASGLRIVGAHGVGVMCNGESSQLANSLNRLNDATVLASRSEWKRGQWSHVETAGLDVLPMGSVAYKMARVAAGFETTTWTAVPKHEWDVAGGAALILAAGGHVVGLDGEPLRFNQENPWLSGAIARTPATEPFRDSIDRLVRATPV